jgi:hypothetical protein
MAIAMAAPLAAQDINAPTPQTGHITGTVSDVNSRAATRRNVLGLCMRGLEHGDFGPEVRLRRSAPTTGEQVPRAGVLGERDNTGEPLVKVGRHGP